MISWRNYPFNPVGTVWPLKWWRGVKFMFCMMGISAVLISTMGLAIKVYGEFILVFVMLGAK